jgi:hypothetical protein
MLQNQWQGTSKLSHKTLRKAVLRQIVKHQLTFVRPLSQQTNWTKFRAWKTWLLVFLCYLIWGKALTILFNVSWCFTEILKGVIDNIKFFANFRGIHVAKKKVSSLYTIFFFLSNLEHKSRRQRTSKKCLFSFVLLRLVLSGLLPRLASIGCF